MAHYFFAVQNQRYGPFDEAKVRALIRTGKIQPTMLAWCEGMEQWAHAGQIPELVGWFKTGGAEPPAVPPMPNPTPSGTPNRPDAGYPIRSSNTAFPLDASNQPSHASNGTYPGGTGETHGMSEMSGAAGPASGNSYRFGGSGERDLFSSDLFGNQASGSTDAPPDAFTSSSRPKTRPKLRPIAASKPKKVRRTVEMSDARRSALKGARVAMFFIGIITLVLGSIITLGEIQIGISQNAIFGIFVEGSVYLVLGVLTMRFPRTTTTIAMLIYLLGMVAILILLPPGGIAKGILLRIVLIYYLGKGVVAAYSEE